MNNDMFSEREILEMLNFIENVDDGDESINLDELKKKKMKKRLMKKICIKNKKRNVCKIAAACVCALTVIFAVPVFAKNIPGIKSIIQALNGRSDDLGEYEKYSKVVNKSITSNGITLTINEIECDKRSLMIGYTIKSKGNIKDIIVQDTSDKRFKTFSFIKFLKVNSKCAESGSSSSGIGRYIDNHTYINSETLDNGGADFPSNFKVDLDINDIYGIKGNWNFKFSVSQEDMLKNTKEFTPNKVVKLPDADITIKNVSFTPINTFINFDGKYSKGGEEDVRRQRIIGYMPYQDFFVFDDKGNEIAFKGSPAGISTGSSDFYYNCDFVSSKYIPKYLTVIPYRTRNIEIKKILKDINGVYPIELSQGKFGEIVINKITTENDKTIVNYSIKGFVPIFRSNGIYIVDDKDNIVDSFDSLGESKKIEGNPNNYIMEFKALDKNKKYKICAYDLSNIEIREDLKFKIDLKK